MTVRTFSTMGTVVSLRLPDDAPVDAAVARTREVFDRYDRTYSLYDPSSPLSAIARGDVRLTDASEEVRDTYAAALTWRTATHGAFTPHRPDGVLDLSGIVKALAIRDAGAVLDELADDWLLNAGGDVLARGGHDGGPWSIGIVDPDRRDALAGVVPVGPSRRALATSGVSERGDHVWRRSAPAFRQVSVRADDIVTADVLATAVLAGDDTDLERITHHGSVDIIAFTVDGGLWVTPAARGWVHRVGG